MRSQGIKGIQVLLRGRKGRLSPRTAVHPRNASKKGKERRDLVLSCRLPTAGFRTGKSPWQDEARMKELKVTRSAGPTTLSGLKGGRVGEPHMRSGLRWSGTVRRTHDPNK